MAAHDPAPLCKGYPRSRNRTFFKLFVRSWEDTTHERRVFYKRLRALLSRNAVGNDVYSLFFLLVELCLYFSKLPANESTLAAWVLYPVCVESTLYTCHMRCTPASQVDRLSCCT
jgi:hypothetical protein